jgi:hypothetical protein
LLPQVADEGEDLCIWTAATNVFNRELQTIKLKSSSNVRVGRGANNLTAKRKSSMLKKNI